MPVRAREVGRAAGALAAAAILLAACGEEDTDGRDDPTAIVEEVQVQLAGHTFEADSVTGHELVEGSTLSVAFEDGVMAVAAGCNTLFGAYVEDDGELRWRGEPASTLIGCPPELAEQDAWLTDLFTEGLRIEEGDADLVLESGSVRLELSRRS